MVRAIEASLRTIMMIGGDKAFSERRRVLGGIAGVAAATIATPLIGAAPDTSSPGLAVEIARRARALAGARPTPLRVLIPEGSDDNLAPIVAAFGELADVVVEPVTLALDDIVSQLLVDRLGGAVDYDLAVSVTSSVPDLVAAGAILPLTTYAARHEPPGLRDGILYAVGDTFDGETYGFQSDGDVCLMFYHRDLLESEAERSRYADLHGVALEIPRTWAELDRQMAFFNRPDENLHGGLLYRSASYVVWEWWMRFHAKGVWPLSPELVPQIDSDAGVAALEDMIVASAHLAPDSNSLRLAEFKRRFERGDIYCNSAWGGTQKYLSRPESTMRDRLRYGPMPGAAPDGGPLATPYFNWGWNYMVMADCPRPELAYLFALFAATPEMSTLSVRQAGGFFDPFRVEHYEDPAIRAIYGEEFLTVHEASLRGAVPDLYLAHHGEYFRVLGQWIARAIGRLVEPSEALGEVARAWENLNPRREFISQRERWRDLRSKYPEQVARHLHDLDR